MVNYILGTILVLVSIAAARDLHDMNNKAKGEDYLKSDKSTRMMFRLMQIIVIGFMVLFLVYGLDLIFLR